MIDLSKNPAVRHLRGLRNNNPGNIRVPKNPERNPWQGRVPIAQNTDKNKAFEQFTSLEYGLRALMINARTQIKKGHNTIRKLIYTWAPPHENHTNNYIAYVSQKLHIPADQIIPALDKNFFISLAKAISEQENGATIVQQVIPYSAYEEAYRLMGSTSYSPFEKKNELES